MAATEFGPQRAAEVRALADALVSGRSSRRDFIRRAAALGLTASAIGAILAACGSDSASPTAGSGTTSSAAASAAASSAPPLSGVSTPGGAAASTSAAPSLPEPTRRGGGGALSLIQWQGPTILNPHLSSGTKDDLVCAPVYEPLVTFDIQGQPVLQLAAEWPTQENGQLAADGKSVTWKLRQGVKWSDGQPFSADDVVFTWEYVTDKATAAITVGNYEGVDRVEKVDDTSVRFTFSQPAPAWFRPAQLRVLPRHIFQNDKGQAARTSPNNLKPVGTGPYKVTNFAPGDAVSYAINENYREANKPFFDTVEVKGGGDAQSAGRAVLQTGEFDYAWNLQLDDAVLKQLENGGRGVAEFAPGGGIERLIYNFSDPNKEVDGERSHPSTPHPFLADLKVRQALTLACDRDTVVSVLYGRGGVVTANIINDPPQFRSSANTAEYNLDKANALLDEAGWTKGGDGARAKGGVRMAILFQTTVNTLRQKTQQIVKDGWEKVGAPTELKSIDSAVFFSSDAGNPDTNSKFYADVEMFTGTPVIDPQSDMTRYHSRYIASKANNWSGRNYSRYNNPEYDKAWDQAAIELDADKRAQLFVQMNDIVIQQAVLVPLVDRKSVFGRAKDLQGINYSPWDSDYWNIANWRKG
jgi:peptide/nickel transport system substrate-binding protein